MKNSAGRGGCYTLSMLQPSGTSPSCYTALHCFISTGLTANSVSVLQFMFNISKCIVRHKHKSAVAVQRNVGCQKKTMTSQFVPSLLTLALLNVLSSRVSCNTKDTVIIL